MLRYVPDAATKVFCDIERLALDARFDVVLYASHLINVGEREIRRAQLDVCRRHLAPGGVHFTARVLEDGDVRQALLEVGLGPETWIDPKWGMAKHAG
jgi:hypothetical protein